MEGLLMKGLGAHGEKNCGIVYVWIRQLITATLILMSSFCTVRELLEWPVLVDTITAAVFLNVEMSLITPRDLDLS